MRLAGLRLPRAEIATPWQRRTSRLQRSAAAGKDRLFIGSSRMHRVSVHLPAADIVSIAATIVLIGFDLRIASKKVGTFSASFVLARTSRENVRAPV